MTDITFYNMWRTETPEGRAALLAQMKAEAPALASKAGFVAMTVLECAGDGRVLVEGRWQSKEAFDTAVADNPEAQKACISAPAGRRGVEAFFLRRTGEETRELRYGVNRLLSQKWERPSRQRGS
jgi:hypothetical protein